MTVEAGFLDAIQQQPNDLGLRLAYADWLEEHGDPRAGMIRVEEEMRSLPIYDDRYWNLKPQRHAFQDYCEEKFYDEWLAALGYHRRYEPVFHSVPREPRYRWRLIREFIERWHGIRLLDGSETCAAAQVDRAQVDRERVDRERVGSQTHRLPESILQWRQLVRDLGRDFSTVFRDRPIIENMSRTRAVSLLVLAEGDVYWAVRHANLGAPDPPVDTYSRYHGGAGPPFSHSSNVQRSLTSFAFAHASSFLGRGARLFVEEKRFDSFSQSHGINRVAFDDLSIFEAENAIAVTSGDDVRLGIWGTTPVRRLPAFFRELDSSATL